jgi:hypothetical protein
MRIGCGSEKAPRFTDQRNIFLFHHCDDIFFPIRDFGCQFQKCLRLAGDELLKSNEILLAARFRRSLARRDELWFVAYFSARRFG